MTKRQGKPRNARKLSTLDDFLANEGKREEFEAVAVKEVHARQKTLAQECAEAATDLNAECDAREWVELGVGDTLTGEDFSGWPGYPRGKA